MIELKGVTKRFGRNFAIKNLSFRSEGNQFIAIVGPAGVGKSTTLRLVAGILHPNYGEIFINDRPMNGVPPERRNASMAFENYVLYSHLTNYDNLAFPLRARKESEATIKEKVLEMAALLHLEAELDRKPAFLSGGQRQRVALGRCLIRPADVYLLDEPISHLDARLKIQMRAQLKSMCSQMDATVLHVTHDYREAMSLADRMIVLNDGRLMQDGTPEQVYFEPANEFVARFVGEPPMGLIDVRLGSLDGKGVLYLEDSDTSLRLPAGLNLSDRNSDGQLRIGVRASDTSIRQAPDDRHTVPGTVYIFEQRGQSALVSVKLREAVISIRVPASERWQIGEQVWVRLEPDRVHVFRDGQAVHHPARLIGEEGVY